MANPFPFTSGQVLTAAQMNGIGENTTFTPSFTGITLGNGTATASYTRVQKQIHLQVLVTFGSTTSVSGTIGLILPVTATSSEVNCAIGNARILDSGSGYFSGQIYLAATTTVYLTLQNTTATYAVDTFSSATVPMTWAVNDQLGFAINYTAA
jgi:hypothetical protein